MKSKPYTSSQIPALLAATVVIAGFSNAAGDPREGDLTVDLGEETEISRVWVAETDFAHTREFSIEVMQGDAWKEVARGTTIGKDKALEFPPIKSRQIRLNILKADGPININEFQVFSSSDP